jgi:hypothetical protein
MASIVKSRRGRWEVRESLRTESGPRSRTLASFARLDDAAITHALSRATAHVSAEDLRTAARRAGAPVALPPADHAAAQLLAALREGQRPREALRRLLVDHLGTVRQPSDAVRSAAEWADATLEERAEALRDLLLLADAVPASAGRHGELAFKPFSR